MSAITIRLAGEPRGKGRPRFSSRGGHVRAFTPQATRSYEGALRYVAQEVMGDKPLMIGALDVLIVAAFSVPKSFSKGKRLAALAGSLRPTVKPDIDNILKVVDALNGVVFEDDKQIAEVRVLKIYSDKPELTIRIMALDTDSTAAARSGCAGEGAAVKTVSPDPLKFSRATGVPA